MAMGTERSKPLHNFTLPCDLRWGNQQFLRCMKVDTGGRIPSGNRADGNSSGSSDHHNHRHHLPIQQRRTTRDRERDGDSSSRFANGSPRAGRAPPPSSAAHGVGRRFAYDDDGGIAATREKVMLDLQTAADKMRNAFFKDGGLDEGGVSVPRPPPPPPPPPPAAEGENNRPWNLRARRATPASGFAAAACGGSSGAGGKGSRLEAPRPNPGSFQMRSSAAAAAQKSPIHRIDGGEAAAGGEKKERAKFSVALSKRHIEEDFFSISGHRPPRRPKKRPRTVQKQLDTLFPGLWLTEVTPDMYKVNEAAP
ncbi:Protein of unknown function (DUF1639 [Striga hermonthica]|uniref:DUF1639 family protein n=1 Tax=Striga hermonthica TaxID=68872 RepID=A0A9N7MTX0_STRHE|nr:Protein of unknown function (DUF1639 [Striga hermonthica]